jgi:hypothetical protein
LAHDCEVKDERAAGAEEVGECAEEVVRCLAGRRGGEHDREDVKGVSEKGKEEKKDGEALDGFALELESGWNRGLLTFFQICGRREVR